MDKDMHLHDETTKLNNYETSETDVGGWQGYVYDLCAIRDRLNLVLYEDWMHPVFVALTKVAPSMTPETEAYVRQVILDYRVEAEGVP